MHTVTFFPLGNADACKLELPSGALLLFDFGNQGNPDDGSDKRIDLAAALRDDCTAADRDTFDVVAFTHADDDHTHGARDFFWLEHADKYQGDGRFKIAELWVPAGFITEASSNLDDHPRVIQAEARYRLRKGEGIRVFSRPTALTGWFEDEGIALADREHLISDAGTIVPGFTLEEQGAEFFVHSPFAVHTDEGMVDRNQCALVLQATLECGDAPRRLLLTTDVAHEVLTDIVATTQSHGNEERLAWDIVKVPHHCSYLSLSDEQGTDITEPVPNVQWLFEQGTDGATLVGTCKPIPSNDDDCQPPHRQAAAYYRERAEAVDGEFVVTMEHPTANKPDRLVVTCDDKGAKVTKRQALGAATIVSRRAPRAG